jgi:uncharacterized protein YceH (UPF0502 family)
MTTESAELQQLDLIEARILGSLIEKEATTPEQYPLTQNAVQLACNQKTSREPLMELEPGEVGHALRALEERRLIKSQHGSRAQRYEHRAAEAFGLTRQQQGVIAVLLLRGAQTVNEIMTRTERLAKFVDAEDLQHTLDRLLHREPPLIVRIPRQAGQREDRYMHLLSGPVDVEALARSSAPSAAATGATAGLADRVAQLEARVAALEAVLAELGG